MCTCLGHFCFCFYRFPTAIVIKRISTKYYFRLVFVSHPGGFPSKTRAIAFCELLYRILYVPMCLNQQKNMFEAQMHRGSWLSLSLWPLFAVCFVFTEIEVPVLRNIIFTDRRRTVIRWNRTTRPARRVAEDWIGITDKPGRICISQRMANSINPCVIRKHWIRVSRVCAAVAN